MCVDASVELGKKGNITCPSCHSCQIAESLPVRTEKARPSPNLIGYRVSHSHPLTIHLLCCRTVIETTGACQGARAR